MCSSSCLLWMLLSLSVRFILSFYCLFSLRNLHSFPTRRSSDLLTNEIESLYVLTKDFLKARTSDLESFKERSEEHTSELQSRGHLVCRLLLEKKKKKKRKEIDNKSTVHNDRASRITSLAALSTT